MPQIETNEVAFQEPVVGEDFIIVQAPLKEDIQLPSGASDGIEVALEPVDRKKKDQDIYNTTLWVKKTYTRKSKLGAFIVAFTDYYKAQNDDRNPKETNNWIGGIIRVLSWGDKNRVIQVRGYADPERVSTLQQEMTARMEAQAE